MNIEKYTHDILIAIAGFVGSLVLICNQAITDLKKGFVAVGTGVSTAIFITPVCAAMPGIKDLGMLTNHRTDYAVAFILGTLGWAMILLLQKKLLKNKNGNDTDQG